MRICSVRQVAEMYSVYKRQRILHYECTGRKALTICRLLREEGMRVSHVGVHKFLQKYKETRSIETRLGLTGEDDGSNEGARRAADEGRWWNDRRSVARSPCKQWLQNDTGPSPNRFIHESFSKLLCNTIVFVPYNGKERSVLPAFCKNEMLTLYCHIP